MVPYSEDQIQHFTILFEKASIPLRVILPSLTWVLHDYFVTLEDEIKYIWPQKRNFGRFMYYWIRYYTIALLVFDVVQIHVFARPGIKSNALCVAMDPITRVAGAISLWSVEIIMQLRVYALFKCSRKVAIFNGVLFAGSIAAFIWILVYNVRLRSSLIATAVRLPIPGCPTINGGHMQWALWIPATVYEVILFGFALYKTAVEFEWRRKKPSEVRERFKLQDVLIHDNLLYFFAIAVILIFNNLMVVGKTGIPWFSFGPFHAAVGILTGRMLVHLRKAATEDIPMESIHVQAVQWHHTSATESSFSEDAIRTPVSGTSTDSRP